ncbi:MAG: hypothetical protein GX795_07260 [Firmicutes bacterium]|nr:hypothetical protein [Bacillota bacterium]
MNRFWKTVITGTAAGALIGFYLYTKSKRTRMNLMTDDSKAERMAGKMTRRIMRTTDRFARDIGKEVMRAGRTMQALGNRLTMGGVD